MRPRKKMPEKLEDLGGTFQGDGDRRNLHLLGATWQPGEAEIEDGVYVDTTERNTFAGDGRCFAGLDGNAIENLNQFFGPRTSIGSKKKQRKSTKRTGRIILVNQST